MAKGIAASQVLHKHHHRKRSGGTLRRYYDDTQLSGFAMSEWKTSLLDLGFNPKTDLVVSWGFANFDRLSMGRIMAVNPTFAVKSANVELQNRRLGLSQMFRAHSSILTTASSSVHETFHKDDYEFR